VLADFGPTPRSWLASVPYALRVAQRTWSLRKQRGLEHEALRARLGEHHTALVTLGKALVARGDEPRLAPLRAAITQVQGEGTKLQHADQGVSRTREGNERALNLLRSEEAHLKEQLAPYLEAEQSALTAQRKAEEEVRRAQAMLKRAEIELRALESATAGVDPAKLSSLSLQLAQRKAALEALTPGMTQTSDALGKARRDLALARGGLDANQEKQRRMEAEARAREAEAEGEKQAAHGAYETALSELAEAALQQRLGELAPEPAARVGETGQAVELAVAGVARFDRALVLYDRNAVQRGVLLALGTVVAVVMVLVMR
jgi:chromosome segregation ATPase